MTALKNSSVRNLGQLLPGVALVPSIAHCPVSGMGLDSRTLKHGDIFIALPGATVDGRQFIKAALRQGVSAVLAQGDEPTVRVETDTVAPVIHIPALRDQVSAIAGYFYDEPSRKLSLVGVTGTNGKTTCSQWLAQLHALLGRKTGVLGTLGYGLIEAGVAKGISSLTETGFTTPDAVETQKLLAQMQNDGAEVVAMEVSSHSLCQGRVAAVRFDTALFTNLSRDHLDYHGTMDDYAKAKQRLFVMPGLKHVVINIDDGWGGAMCSAVPSNVELIRYSLSDEQADIYTRQVNYSPEGIEAEVVSPWGSAELRCGLLGDFNLSNLLGVIAATVVASGTEEATFAEIMSLLPQLQPVAGRMQRVLESNEIGTGDIRVIIDYAHTPDALEKTLQALHTHTPGKICCLFGCGGDRDRGKRAEMGAAAARLAERLVITSDNPRTESQQQIFDDILQGIESRDHCLVVESRRQAIATAIARAQPGDTVLLAGKGHEDYQIIGTEKLPFSDLEEARQALRRRREGMQ